MGITMPYSDPPLVQSTRNSSSCLVFELLLKNHDIYMCKDSRIYVYISKDLPLTDLKKISCN